MDRPSYPSRYRARVEAADDHQWSRGFLMGVVAGVCTTLGLLVVGGVLL